MILIHKTILWNWMHCENAHLLHIEVHLVFQLFMESVYKSNTIPIWVTYVLSYNAQVVLLQFISMHWLATIPSNNIIIWTIFDSLMRCFTSHGRFQQVRYRSSIYYQSKNYTTLIGMQSDFVSAVVSVRNVSKNNRNAWETYRMELMHFAGVYIQRSPHFGLISMTLSCYLHFHRCVFHSTMEQAMEYDFAKCWPLPKWVSNRFSNHKFWLLTRCAFYSKTNVMLPVVMLQIPDFHRCSNSLKMSRLFLVLLMPGN